MRIPAKLFKSRHGVFYYRFQFQDETKRRELRFSLHTKCPTIAKSKAVQISAIILRNKFNGAGMASNFNPDDPSTWGSVLGNTQSHRKLDIELPGGTVLRNINNPNDVENAKEIMREFLSITTVEDKASFIAGSSAQKLSLPVPAKPEQPQGGMTLDEIIQRYATRMADRLASKSLYEYGNYHGKFAKWIALRKNNKHYPIRLITRADVGDYIDDLKAQNISDSTIKQKYLAAIGGLFELAQTLDAYPKGEIPTRGHGVFTKRDKRKVQVATARKPFTDDDLAVIFNPDKYLAREKPDDFWLPLLVLFTGCRISELCQLAISDVAQVKDVWAISINDDGYKKLKTPAARRWIPIHPQLIKIGFLDYVKDASRFDTEFGKMLFPYMTADPHGTFSATSGENFSKYIRGIGIKDPQKVFHSFRFTVNNRLKQNQISEETRCQFLGHEYHTTNSSSYSEPHNLPYLLENVSSKLVYLEDWIPCVIVDDRFVEFFRSLEGEAMPTHYELLRADVLALEPSKMAAEDIKNVVPSLEALGKFKTEIVTSAILARNIYNQWKDKAMPEVLLQFFKAALGRNEKLACDIAMELDEKLIRKGV